MSVFICMENNFAIHIMQNFTVTNFNSVPLLCLRSSFFFLANGFSSFFFLANGFFDLGDCCAIIYKIFILDLNRKSTNRRVRLGERWFFSILFLSWLTANLEWLTDTFSDSALSARMI